MTAGSPGRGRPAIGRPIAVRLPADVVAWVEACAEVWGATELAEQARDTAVGRAHDLAHEAARAHYWRDELASIYRVVPLGLSAQPGAWLRWISEGRDAASLRPWATPRTWIEYTADPVSLVLATLRCSPGQGADTA